MRRYVWYPALTFILIFLCLSCGIEEYYYLPQVPQPARMFNTEATIILPDKTGYNFFKYYKIYYKIYLSENINLNVDDSKTNFSNEYNSDFALLSPYADPSNSLASSSIDHIFRNRNFFELNFLNVSNYLMMPTDNILTIKFSTGSLEYPAASLETGQYKDILLLRSINDPVPNPYFINTDELRADSKNVDVAQGNGSYSYVSMYIVAVGYDSDSFAEVYSKPTHINLFKLPD